MVCLLKNWKVIGSTLLMVGVAAILWNIHPWLFGIGLIALTSVASIVGWSYSRRDAAQLAAEPHRRPSVSQPPVVSTQPDAAEDTGDLIEQMLKQGRYALLLRPQIVANLATEQMQRALAELDERMALVPNGDVVLRASRYEPGDEDDLSALERVVRVDPLFLDRYPVTNRQYKAFVDAGGYEQISLWDSSVWPAILDFVDSTGHSGPRYWKDGAYPSKEEDHPVVGICWYEANAYARWVGKRLPTDPEWVKAGGWPVSCEGGRPLQRKHPWGETMDRNLANLWGTGPGRTTSVHEFNNGGSVGGVYQLIGNCWEWTTSNFGAWDPALRRLETPSQMKSVRGGGYDTYFDSQANTQFQSGDSPMARKHNIGFRCALGVCDIGDLEGSGAQPEIETVEQQTATALAGLEEAVV